MRPRTRPRRRPSAPWLAAALRALGPLLRSLLAPPARALRGTARRVADPARQVLDYWASERRTMRQGFAAVVVASLTSLFSGLALVGMENRLVAVPGLLMLVPASIAMRGNIFGALAARAATAIHSGLFEVSRSRTGVLGQNVVATGLLTLATSAAMGVLARGLAGLLGIHTVPLWDLVLVATVAAVLSSTVVLAVTLYLAVASFRRGWDLDAVAAPLITAIGDVVTLPCLWLASYLSGIPGITPVFGAVALVCGVAALVVGWGLRLPVARRIVQESYPVLSVAIVLDLLAGTVVEPRVEPVFTPYPAFLILLPGFLENTGALGAILASRLGSKLHLGAVRPRARPDAVALLDASVVLGLGAVVYVLTAVTTLPVAALTGAEYPGWATFTGVVAVGGALATLLAAVIGYYAAVATFRFGLDPDNHTIPLVTSGMDLMGVICLVTALVLFGVA